MVQTMAGWTPDRQHITQLARLLDASLSDSNAVRIDASNHLEEAQKSEGFNGYLAYIMAYDKDKDLRIRSAAGLLLKNTIRLRAANISPDTLSYIKEASLHGLGDEQHLCRSICGNVITTVVCKGGIVGWPEVLSRLVGMLDSDSITLQDGAFSALCKICEDSARALDMQYGGQRPLEYLVTKFLSYTKSPNPNMRSRALFCLNQFVPLLSEALMVHIDDYLTSLFALATDDSPDVRKHVCRAIVVLLDARPDKIAPNLRSIVEYMMYSTQDQDEQVAIEACEFWLSVADSEVLRPQLEPYLPQIVPMLLKGMVYSEMDILTLGGDEDDYNIADKEQDIRPQFSRAAKHTLEHVNAQKPAVSIEEKPTDSKADDDDDDDENDEDYDDDEDDDDDDLYSEWNLRKCSAAALDSLSSHFQDKLLVQILPYLKQNLPSQDWKVREASVLALGAIAEGCLNGLTPHLPELYPYLLSLLKDSKHLIRQITCWTLGRYSGWAAGLSDPVDKAKYYEPLMQGLLSTVYDSNKRVQDAGCSAFANLEEQSQTALIPYIEPILQHFLVAFQRFQRKNVLILYDAIQTLADVVQSALDNPTYIQMLVPPLLERWANTDNDDLLLISLLECLYSVIIALGIGYLPYAENTYRSCIRILVQFLDDFQRSSIEQGIDSLDHELLIGTIDLLSGLTQAMGDRMALLISANEPSLLQLLNVIIKNEIPEIRQSAYALLGDLSVACFVLVEPFLPSIMPELVSEVDPNSKATSVCNNAAWAAGEIALKLSSRIEPWVGVLLPRLIAILYSEDSPDALLENAAITIGRLGLAHPDLVASQLEHIAPKFCACLENVKDNEEKDSAFRGLCMIVQRNPNGLIKHISSFAIAVGKFEQPSTILDDMFSKILMGYQSVMTNWREFMCNLPSDVQQTLHSRYQL